MYGEQQVNQENDTRECEAMRKMFVGGLNRDTPEDKFFEYFEQFGEMVDKVIIRDMTTKQSRGFGFITYRQSDSVENVFNSRPHELDGKTLDVKRAMPREFNTPGAHSKTKKLFVGGFKGSDVTPEDLQSYIESRHPTSFGTVDKVDFLKDRESGQYKGFGFLECSSHDFADRLAISEMSFSLKGRTLSIKKAEPKEGSGGPGMQGPGGPRGGMRGGPRGGRGGPQGGRGMRGGGGPMRGGRGGRGGGGMGRGGYGGNESYGGDYGSGSGSYSTAYPSYNMNDGYNQNHSAGYGQNYQNPGYGQQSNQGGGYGAANTPYGQQSYGAMGGGYDQTNSYGGQNYNQGGGYGNQNYGGGRGASRGGGNNRYQPY